MGKQRKRRNSGNNSFFLKNGDLTPPILKNGDMTPKVSSLLEGNMARYGRGLNREIVAAVNDSLIQEPFSTKDIRELVKIKGWKPGPSENHINVTLANAASDEHSPTYRKYFISVGNGQYKIKNEYKGRDWC